MNTEVNKERPGSTFKIPSTSNVNRLIGACDFWLVVWVLWHINLCRLFNDKSIFMKKVQFQTIQFRIITQFKYKYNLIVKNISISSYSV